MKPLVVLDIVGLTARQIGPQTPRLQALAERGALRPMTAILPAVTCSAQATMLTGEMPAVHGAVGNGWLDRKTRDVALWRQSNDLVEAEKVYETAREEDPGFRCAKLFWWWNMGARVDYSITPRPFYPADGSKILAIYAQPHEYGARMERELGPFPFFNFWGPKSGLPSSRWIADAAIRTLEEHQPHLTLVYLPHLDYDHQRYGPTDPRSVQALREIDAVFGDLEDATEWLGGELIVVSEYGILPVTRHVDINLALRRAGLLAVRETPKGDILDTFASRAFALSDHQVAHVYTQDGAAAAEAREALADLDGIDRILSDESRREAGLDHANAGDLVCVSKPEAWFTYTYWEEPAGEPDFARTIDIHRKPGYDPCEMFLDPAIKLPILKIASFLARKKLGFRSLMKVIPIQPELIRGSHGRLPQDPADGPVFLSSRRFGQGIGPDPENGVVEMTSIKGRILELIRELR